MALASALGIGLGVLVARGVGGGPDVLGPIAAALALAAIVMVVPLVGPPLVTAHTWGLAAMGASMGRTLLAMGGMMVLITVLGLPAKPVVYGLLSGAVLMMAAEAGIAVRVLARVDRDRKGSKLTATPGPAPAARAGSAT
jgi:hypothetical protein